MVKVEVNGEKFYMDEILKNNLDTLRKLPDKDMDCPIVIDGGEGDGKSTLGLQIATYLDPTFNISRVINKPMDFINAILNGKPGQAILYDESRGGLNKMRSISDLNVRIVDLMAECRQFRLFIIFILPSYFDLDKNIALWRSKALIHVFHDKQFNRGFFHAYGEFKKTQLFVKGRKFYNYRVVKPDFKGRFTKFYPKGVPENEYRKLKADGLRAYDLADESTIIMKDVEKHRAIITQKLKDKFNVTYAEIGRWLGISNQGVSQYVKRYHQYITKPPTKPK